MTDHNEPSNRHDGDFDPVVAERFRVLDRVTPPNVARGPVAAAAPGGLSGPESSGPRSGFLLVVAACVGVVLVGFAALVAVSRGDGTESEQTEGAGDPADISIVADGAPDTTAAPVVEGDHDVRSTTRSAAGGDEVESSVTTVTTAGDGPDRGVPAADGDGPVVTFATETTETTESPETPETTDTAATVGSEGGEAGDSNPVIVAVRGTVTEVFTDCVSRLVLTETGQVIETGPISCDGGSFIVVDGTRIFTSSGYTSADLAYDKHPSNLKPGMDVVVTAVRIGGSGPLTLDCDSCRIRRV